MSRFHATYNYLDLLIPDDIEIIRLDLIGNSKRGRVLHSLIIFVEYLYFTARILSSSRNRFIFREFHTKSIGFLVAIKILKGASDLYLIVNHNAVDRSKFISMRKRLEKYRIYLIQFESMPESLPFPLAFDGSPPIKTTSGLPVVTVLGSYRPEKAFESILGVLSAAVRDKSLYAQLVLASDRNIVAENDQSVTSFLDTKESDDYLLALKRSNVVILPYGKDYEYRTSGVLFDCISAGCTIALASDAVLMSDFIERENLGLSYEGAEDLVEKINRLIDEKECFNLGRTAFYERRSTSELTAQYYEYFSKN